MTAHLAEAGQVGFVSLAVAAGVDLPVALFAGGETGMLVVDAAGRDFERWSNLATVAEQEGLSSLLFGTALPEQADEAVTAARKMLKKLGAQHIVLTAAGADSTLALRLAAKGSYSAVALVSPLLTEEAEAFATLASVWIPKLVLVGSEDSQGSATAQRLYRAAIGRFVLRQFPVSDRGSDLLAGDWSRLVIEAIVDFVVYSCGNGGAIASGSG